MPNRPHPRNPSRTKLFSYLDRGLDIKAAAKRAGYRRSPPGPHSRRSIQLASLLQLAEKTGWGAPIEPLMVQS
jgi:hypothetical protein